MLTKAPVLRFMDKDQKYFVEFSHACDMVLQQHPLGTNISVSVSTNDASLPPIIRDLHPLRIWSSDHGVGMIIGEGWNGFGIEWWEDESNANLWTLSTTCESHTRVAYTETR